MATLTWFDGDSPRAADLPSPGAATVGRRSDANVVVQDDTVSRIHFIVRANASGVTVENLSQSTNTLHNGSAIGSAAALADLDTIQAGAITFQFHDLDAAAGHQEVLCSHCQRGNGLERRECWFCGTSMVNAPTSGFRVARPWCRLVGATGAVTVFDGEGVFLQPDGSLGAAPTASRSAPVVVAGDGGPMVPADAPGNPAIGGAAFHGALKDGAVLEIAGQPFVVLVRA